MALFQKATDTNAFLKMGIFGFAGSGKTMTSTLTAIGLIHYMRERNMPLAGKPLFFLYTEQGSNWVRRKIEDAGIELYTAKTRAFTDLLAATKEAELNASLLLVDSLTHFWTELTTAYAKKQKRNRLYFEDWAYLKTEWRRFTDAFINAPTHTILAGRAAFEYDYFENDAGKKELEKTNIRMRAEGEMGYEPDLLVLMERETDMETKKVSHIATVMKDRSTELDGKKFVNPTFASFLPHIQLLNLGGRQLGIDTSRTSEDMLTPEKKDWNPVQRRICIDEIQSLLVLHIPGQAAVDKQRKLQLIRKHFAEKSWTEIEEVMPLFDLRAGYDALHRELESKPSRYTANVPTNEVQSEATEAIVPTTGVQIIPGDFDQLTSTVTLTAPPPADDELFDQDRWLAERTSVFERCADFPTYGLEMAAMLAAKPQVTAEVWKRAVKLSRATAKRLQKDDGDLLAAG
ncbi:MAG: AAA family ATPase [Steroidobacteraceae bacterium]